VADLARTEAMYCRGLGWRVLARFADHEGFDGIVLGDGAPDHHFEFTHCPSRPVRPTPTVEDLWVWYLPDRDEWQRRCERLLAAGFVPVAPHNPYWDRCGRSFADADGYRLVLYNAAWPSAAPT
jgi:catechol 2,3-dioxygenase-like lactoylglutathione lyase family enzyme